MPEVNISAAPAQQPKAAHTASEPLLHAHSLAKKFGNKHAVSDVSLAVHSGEIVALLGPNGAGKSTTINMCSGLLKPDAGELTVLGATPTVENWDSQWEKIKVNLGIMPQAGGAYPAAKCRDILELVAGFTKNSLDVSWLLSVLNLADVAHVPYRRLSGGQQQRLSLACAIVNRPQLIFLDEPSAGLDVEGQYLISELLVSLRRDGVGIVLTSHSMNEIERLADRIYVINEGKIVITGTVEEIVRRGEQKVYFQGPPRLNMDLLQSALPEGYACIEQTPGNYCTIGEPTPQVVSTIAAYGVHNHVLFSDIHVGHRNLEQVLLDLFNSSSHKGNHHE